MKKYILLPLLCGLLLTGCGSTESGPDTEISAISSIELLGIPDKILPNDKEPFNFEFRGRQIEIAPEQPAYLCIDRQYSANNSETPIFEITTYYDQHDKPIKTGMGDSSSSCVNEYDENGNLTKKYVISNSSSPEERKLSSVSDFEYYPDGTLKASDTDNGKTSIVHCDYNEKGDLICSSESDVKYEYSFSEDGLTKTETAWKDGEKLSETTYVFNDHGDIIEETQNSSDETAPPHVTKEYSYNSSGLCIEKITRIEPENKYLKNTKELMTYDDNDRLIISEKYVIEDSGREVLASHCEYYYDQKF
ncbi:MAG: hypothetical protein IKS13_08900 [Ruminococcus sp.]|nr:hypothetical protein [Ruminococcus sp.]